MLIEQNGSLMFKENEERKKNIRFISSIMYGRCMVFYPSRRETPKMIEKQMEVIKSGKGIEWDNPLGEAELISIDKRRYNIRLFNNFLLVHHREILEYLLTEGQSIQLSENHQNSGKQLRWSNIFASYGDDLDLHEKAPPLDVIPSNNTVVLTMSLYELNKCLNRETGEAGYKRTMGDLLTLKSALLMVKELLPDGGFGPEQNISFLDQVVFGYDNSIIRNKKSKRSAAANRVFVTLDKTLLENIVDHGYFSPLDQTKMLNYQKPSMKSFVKYIKTHTSDFIDEKPLVWLVNMYIKSSLIEMGVNTRQNILKECKQEEFIRNLADDFDIQIYRNKKKDGEYYVRSVAVDSSDAGEAE